MAYFTEPTEVLDHFYNLLKTKKGQLGLGYVGYADENLLPVYPAVVVSYNNPVDRALHATRQFALLFAIQFVVYHARLSTDVATRTREDMLLAQAIRDLLHEDYTLRDSDGNSRIIFGYVASERPGIVADNKGQANVATTLIWTGESRAFF